ncbi:MAG: suppressor of fused domain protein [Gammaproteobacteria bacterium]|nr:suppressor of fused domain protein [Gammaproteobacteria bacterium]
MKSIIVFGLLLNWGLLMAKDIDSSGNEQSGKEQSAKEQLWNQVYDARQAFVERHIGALPDDILKIVHLGGTWPGGGLFKFKATQLEGDYWVYMTFGLTNPDMPTTVTPTDVEIDPEPGAESTSLRLVKKEQVPSYPERIGYGYELMIITKGEQEWPLWLLQWAVEAELIGDVDFLGRVEQYQGLTVEDIKVGPSGFVNVLFQTAQAPLPSAIDLPAGKSPIIVATVITDDEMRWSQSNGRDKLFARLMQNQDGQVSDIQRPSIFHPKGVDLANVNSREAAVDLYEQGLLRKAHLFPTDFGGEDVEANTIYLPKSAFIEKYQFEQKVLQYAQQGLINNYTAQPIYQGDSFVPAKLQLSATGQENISLEIHVF